MDRTCMECGKPLVGRADKKFCDDQCRTSFHNREYREDLDFLRNVQSILKKNRKILAELYTGNNTKIPFNYLKLTGYNFDFSTHSRTTRTGETYFFCFDYGFSRTGEDACLIIKQEIPVVED